MSRDNLNIFDEIDDPQQAPQEFESLREEAEPAVTPARSPWKRILLALLLLAVIALGIFRFNQWRADKNENAQQQSQPAQTSVSLEATPTASSTYVDGNSPQAVQTRESPSANVVSIPPATKPTVDTKNPESVMKGFITIVNSRDSADDFSRVEEWAQPYSLIDDMSDFDVYHQGANKVLPAPVTVRDIDVKDPIVGQPADSSIRRSRVLNTTVEAHTGQKLLLEWKVTAMKDGDNWKVTDAALDSWSGVK